MIELIIFGENRQPQCIGSCKLVINRIKKLLIVTSANDPLKIVTALFKWKFQRKKNILFVFAEDSFEDFALIFDKEIRCKKVFNLILQKTAIDTVKYKLFEERFLIPILRKIEQSEMSSFNEMIANWIKRYNQKKRRNGIFWKLYSSLNCDEKSGNCNEVVALKRKRQYAGVENGHTVTQEELEIVNSAVTENSEEVPAKKQKLFFEPEYSETLDESRFKLVTFRKAQKEFRRCLIIFLSADDKTMCFEYFWNHKQKAFYCSGCRIKQKNNTAVMDNLESVKLEDKLHDCYPILYEPHKYMDIEIVKKPNYEVIENCDEHDSKYIIVFSSSNRSQCHEYKWKKGPRRFECSGCEKVVIKLWETDLTEKHVEIYNFAEHQCSTTTYDPEKYFQFSQFVLLPNFEIRTEMINGNEKKLLVIFNEDDKNICYYYCQHANSGDRYYCRGCNTSSKDVTAKVYQNSDGEDYVILSSAEHVCTIKTYVKETKEIIVYPPNFKFMDSPKFHLPKLFIFDEKDPSLCCTFSPVPHGDKNKYYCISCDFQKRKTTERTVKLLNGVEVKGVVSAYLCKNDATGEYYVQMYDDRKHLCKPKKFNPQKYMIKSEITLNPSEFFLFRSNEKVDEIRAAVYSSKTRKSCYIFRCTKRSKSFACVKCVKMRGFVSARLYVNEEEGYEYFKVKDTKHVCSPINVSLLNKSGITVLKESGLNLIEEKNEIDESKIIRNFELRNGDALDRKLFIFFNQEKTLCYQFNYSKYRDEYRCIGCTRKHFWVKAKLHVNDESGEMYITMGQRDHGCEPIKYENIKEKEVFTKDFVLIKNDVLPPKLIIFTSPSKEQCYIYHKYRNDFHCAACHRTKSKKILTAKICISEDGQERVKLFRTDHICSPTEFNPSEFETKIISESDFMLFDGTKGQPNNRLVIFDPAKEDYIYEFKFKSKKSLICIACLKQNQTTIARLREKENGEKFIILEKEHCCNSILYDPEKYIPKKIIYDNFAILPSKTKGIKRLIIFDENDKYSGYTFLFQKYCNTFLCDGCEATRVRAKLNIDSNGKQFLELGTRKHSCAPKNFFNEGQIFRPSEFKYIEDGKAIIVNHKKHPPLCYKLIYDEKEEAFCCMNCFNGKSITAAVVTKHKNDDEEFLILNKSHVCTPFLQNCFV